MRKNWTILFQAGLISLVILTACSERKPNSSPGKDGQQSGLMLDPRFNQADSLVVVFYKDPYGEDSLRYTRFYTQSAVTDTAGINILKAQLNSAIKKENQIRDCRNEGKIWCFSNGRVFQTIYFSTRCDDCCFVYLIRDGNFYYSSLFPRFSDWLAKIKPISKEPEGNEGE